MSDLSELAGRRIAPRITQPMEATVVAAPASASAMLRVEVDVQRGYVRECPWMPRPGSLPSPGDAALVTESDAGELWVIAWWPAGP